MPDFHNLHIVIDNQQINEHINGKYYLSGYQYILYNVNTCS